MHQCDADDRVVRNQIQRVGVAIERVAALDAQKCRMLAGATSGAVLAQVAHDREVRRTLRKACPEPSQVSHQRAGTAICPPQGIGGDHPSSAAYLRFTNTREVDLAVEAAAKNSV